jgi:hypothetical protein
LANEKTENQAAECEQAVLKRLLAMPPQPKTKAKLGAKPKKRGRPKKKSAPDS